MLRPAGALIGLLLTASINAQGPAGGVESDFEMRDFKFSDESTLPVLRIHYTTLGHPK